ncbi:sulfite exporter TauE/SafE family protein [Leptospira ellisii]|uniref:Sulfite exporter TauE/SafE family protein n=1 Tax=Leptospira ellisii TaxID=2023197 RepID=A0AAE4TYL1_9LEPT|nr:sulfite exporter TauE/SafE family protein [Leptospira ellisii]MDV6235760.1 sulfite exporter TauE/SafE family protein [Leptospira ellisii]
MFNKFYLRCGMSKEEIVATRAANEILLHLIKLVLYALFGLINAKVIAFGLITAFAAIVSTLSAKKVLSWVSDVFFKKIGYSAMAVSGVALLIQSITGVVSDKQADFSLNPLQQGLEAKIRWQHANFSFEFTIDDGIEFEQVIPTSDLDPDRKTQIERYGADINADTIVIEAVYGSEKKTYEAYFFRNREFIKKIEFD